MRINERLLRSRVPLAALIGVGVLSALPWTASSTVYGTEKPHRAVFTGHAFEDALGLALAACPLLVSWAVSGPRWLRVVLAVAAALAGAYAWAFVLVGGLCIPKSTCSGPVTWGRYCWRLDPSTPCGARSLLCVRRLCANRKQTVQYIEPTASRDQTVKDEIWVPIGE